MGQIIPCQSDMEGMNRYDARTCQIVSYTTMADGGLYQSKEESIHFGNEYGN